MSGPFLSEATGTTARADFFTTCNDISATHCPSQDTRLPKAAVVKTSPGKDANFLSIYLADLQLTSSDSFGLCFVWQTHPLLVASSTFCSSGRRFTLGFLQIPPRGGHPCHQLTLPTIKARSGLTP
jgi:hypothetical protein